MSSASQVESIFFAALEKKTPSELAAYLDQACGHDAGLRRGVERLLRAHPKAADFLGEAIVDRPESKTDETASGALAGPETEATPDAGAVPRDLDVTGLHTPRPDGDAAPASVTLEFRSDAKPNFLIAGRYTLQEKIGEGGMGEVWVAKQSEPVKRKVALKLIKQGMDSRAVLQRFEQERQALAMMDHPNIAKVLDAGLTPNGQPFFAMELVNGLPLNKFCDEARLTTKDRLELFVTICQAVQHAHQKGIVHRDLKPANILITIDRRQARPEGHRLRRGQGDRRQAHRRVDVHAVRRHRRHARIHVARSRPDSPARTSTPAPTSTRWA